MRTLGRASTGFWPCPSHNYRLRNGQGMDPPLREEREREMENREGTGGKG